MRDFTIDASGVTRRGLGVVLFVTLALGIAIVGPAAATAGNNNPDATSYAQANGVSVAEANRRLKLQATAGDLDEQIADAHADTYGGLWLQHSPVFRIVVLATDGNAEIWRGLPASFAADGNVEVRTAPYTLAALEDEQEAIGPDVEAMAASMEINVPENRIDILPTTASTMRTMSSSVASPMVWVDPQVHVSGPTANSYGGLALSNGCTTGFTVQSGSTVGFVTAGHCEPNSGVTLGGLATTFQSQYLAYGADAQWHSTPNHTDLKVFYDGGSNRPVHSVRSSANQAINSYLCKYGKTTGYKCGYLVSKTYKPSWVPFATATFHHAEPRGGPDMSSEGDSGGPVFINNEAWGIVSGQYGAPWCICDLIYDPSNAVQTYLSVSISTQ